MEILLVEMFGVTIKAFSSTALSARITNELKTIGIRLQQDPGSKPTDSYMSYLIHEA